jgi:DNA invertase Pin-like site-specific DNA recombinase/DNA-binding winged helix-turn-helix (wHTH) protein
MEPTFNKGSLQRPNWPKGGFAVSSGVSIPAAQYVRMSTENQQYSIANQKDAIEQYAHEHGYRIVATYSDEARSGISLRRRPALKHLINDVLSEVANFKVILVYDVSRWGRFQDTDEAAHYEFLCKSAGIPVRYCGEQFSNDGTVPNSIMKALKRAMAAEYSRELGVKVCAGQVRLAKMGFRVAGTAGPGLRRMTVTLTGQQKTILEAGERKAIKTHHIILVPGPRGEVSIVREIFRLASDKRKTPTDIARELNRRKMWVDNSKRWNSETVWKLLKNEKYMGSNVFGKSTRKLGAPSRTLPQREWIVVPKAFTPLIDPEVFQKVQRNIQSRNHTVRVPDEFFLRRLHSVLARHGKITLRLSGIHSEEFVERFGSTMQAYKLVGYEPSEHAFKSVANQAKAYNLRANVLAELKRTYPENLRLLHLPGQSNRQVLEFDHHVRVAVHICGQVRKTTVSRQPRWLLKAQPLEAGYPALVCLPDQNLDRIIHYYLVPQFVGVINQYKVLKPGDKWFAAGRKIEELSELRTAATLMSGEWQERDDTSMIGDTVISLRSSTVTIGREEISLPPVQAELFKLLVRNAGTIVPRAQLKHPFRESAFPSAHLNAHISELRRRLGPRFRTRIKTVVGTGYKYEVLEHAALKLSSFWRAPSTPTHTVA